MNRKKLINFVDFLINSYESGLTVGNVVKSLVESSTYRDIGKKIEEDVVVNKLPLFLALRKKNLVPLDFTYVLEAAEKSGQFTEILKTYIRVLEDQEKIEDELRGYKGYLFLLNFILLCGIGIFYFIFNNVVLKIVENKSGSMWKILDTVHSLLNPINVGIFFSLIILLTIFLSFRNPILDLFEYYVLGRPYRELIFSQLMNIWGNLISAGVPLLLSLFISSSTIPNNYFKSVLLSYFSKITGNFVNIDKKIIRKVFDVFPADYQLLLKNSYETGVIDKELIKSSEKIFEKSSKNLKRKIMLIMILVVFSVMVLVGGMIIISFLSIYLPLMEDVN